MHNVEHDYYENLSNGETNLIKKVYLKNESKKLELFEKNLQSADALAVISKNDYNYYEDSHYLAYVGELVAAKIFNDKSVEVPEDFGVLVTKDNIDEHLENLRKQIQAYDVSKFEN